MENVASLLPNGPLTALIGSSSMSGSNTLTDQTGSFTAAGSPSETIDDTELRKPEVTAAGPEIPVGTRADRKATDGAYNPAPDGWKMLPDNGYTTGDFDA